MLVFDKFASLTLAMMFPPSNPVRALPANAAAWARRVAAATRDNHYTAWGDDILPDAHASKLVTALPKMQYVTISGQQHLPLSAQRYRVLARATLLGRGLPPLRRPRVRLVGGHARLLRGLGRGRRPAGLVADKRDCVLAARAFVGIGARRGGRVPHLQLVCAAFKQHALPIELCACITEEYCL